MKNNLSIALNVVLLFAVAVLFYLHFSSSKAIANVKDSADSAKTNLSFRIPKNLAGARVLYINVDSINANYEAFGDLYRAEGGTLEQQYEQYQVRANNWQRRNAILQERASKGTISADSAQIEETFLIKEEKALIALEKYLNNLNNSAMEKSALINEEVFKYFNEYSKSKGIDYILAYGSGSPIVYANDSLDVTRDVVEALNANYRQNKGKNLLQLPK